MSTPRSTPRATERSAAAGGLAVLFNRALLLSDWNVSLRLLSCSRHEVLKEARRLHQQDARRHVVALNKSQSTSPNHGWTGQL